MEDDAPTNALGYIACHKCPPTKDIFA